jgi:integrase
MEAKVKLKYVDHFIDHRGRHRYRIRMRGHPKTELPVNGDVNSHEFQAAYHATLRAMLRGEKPGEATAALPANGKPGTVANAITEFVNSTTFKTDAETTQALRKPKLMSVLRTIGNHQLAQMDDGWVRRWLEQASTPSARRTRLLALRSFTTWAVDQKMIATDPTAGIKVKVKEGDGHPTWEPEQVEQYRAHHALGTRARLALELLLTVTARRSDALALGKQHLKNGGKWLSFVQRKNRRRKPSNVEMPIPSELAAAIEACPAPADSMTFLVNARGLPYSEKNFNDHFRAWCNEAELPDTCVPHGVRKAGCKLLADSGCTTREIMSISGHRTSKEVDRYTQAYSRKQAAIRALAKIAAAKDSNVVALPVAAKR